MKTYKTTFDAWVLVPAVALVFLGLAAGFSLMESSLAMGWTLLGATAGGVLSTLVIGVPCEYYLEDDRLMIRNGLFSHFVAYEDITEISTSSGFSLRPGWSFRRVNINYSGGSLSISPEKRDDFLVELEKRIDRSTNRVTTP